MNLRRGAARYGWAQPGRDRRGRVGSSKARREMISCRRMSGQRSARRSNAPLGAARLGSAKHVKARSL